MTLYLSPSSVWSLRSIPPIIIVLRQNLSFPLNWRSSPSLTVFGLRYSNWFDERCSHSYLFEHLVLNAVQPCLCLLTELSVFKPFPSFNWFNERCFPFILPFSSQLHVETHRATNLELITELSVFNVEFHKLVIPFHSADLEYGALRSRTRVWVSSIWTHESVDLFALLFGALHILTINWNVRRFISNWCFLLPV